MASRMLPEPRFEFESAETAKLSKSDDELREELLRKLVDRELLGPTREIMLETEISKLPVRELPPGNTSSLFLMYLAFCRSAGGSDSTPASKSTFFAVAKLWHPALRFRRKSDHAMCVECSRLKSLINDCKDTLICISQNFLVVCHYLLNTCTRL